MLLTILPLLFQALAVSAQSAFASNATLDPRLISGELTLSFSEGNMNVPYPLSFATHAAANVYVTLSSAYNRISGDLVLASPSRVLDLMIDNIAFLSCDAANYTGEIGLGSTIGAVTNKITSNSDIAHGAIVLYTTTSTFCNFSLSDNYRYTNVFVLPMAQSALKLAQYLQSQNTTSVPARIFKSMSDNGTTTGDTGSGNGQQNMPNQFGPSTTVAMIILYSVTGIITVCFVVVIVSGAMRARRHPERYGLLNIPGASRQQRARGIARAMLETIPIVKFGEREPPKAPADVEQGIEMQTPVASEPTRASTADESRNRDVSPAATLDMAAATPLPADEDETIVDSDNGLACSVCTEDFIKGQDLRMLPCNHKFHPECIDPWLLNVSGTCPLCRIDLRPPEEAEVVGPAEGAGGETAAGQQPGTTAAAPSYPSLRLSTFLNRPRMRDATPNQRILALRNLRNSRQNNSIPPVIPESAAESTAPGTAAAAPADTARRSSRMSRFLGRNNDTAGQASGIPVPRELPLYADPLAARRTAIGSPDGTRSRPVPSLYQMSMSMHRGR